LGHAHVGLFRDAEALRKDLGCFANAPQRVFFRRYAGALKPVATRCPAIQVDATE